MCNNKKLESEKKDLDLKLNICTEILSDLRRDHYKTNKTRLNENVEKIIVDRIQDILKQQIVNNEARYKNCNNSIF